MKHNKTLQDSLGQLIHQYKRHIRAAVNANALGLTGMHVKLIHTIESFSELPCTANDLVQLLARDKAQIARLIKELIANNIIEKLPNPDDKRSQLLKLTTSGKALTQQIKQADQDIKQQMQRGLSEQELELFESVLEKMVKNLKD